MQYYMVPRQYRMKNTSHVINLPFLFQPICFFSFRRYFSSVWLNWLQNVNNKKEDQRQNILKMNERCFNFCIAFGSDFVMHMMLLASIARMLKFLRRNVLNVDVVMWIRNIFRAKCAKNKHPFIPIYPQMHVLRYARRSLINLWSLLP